MYPLAKRALFRLEPERAHDLTARALAWCGRRPGALRLLGALYRVADPRLEVEAFGLRFPNPVGLAAGMDKDGRALPAWPALGFGAVELGSVTALAQPGNPRPRLFRLVDDEALVNRMGFNNDGAERVAARLERWRAHGLWPEVPVGINLGKSKLAPLERAAEDYSRSLALLAPHADYLVVNVSSPNTPGLRRLQERAPLAELLAVATAASTGRPLLLKVSPDLALTALDEVLELCVSAGVAGVIATNTTLSRTGLRRDPGEAGGLSGRPLRARSLELLRHIRASSALPVVSVGGVMDGADVVTRLRAGATLVQGYTGFVYGGPGWAGSACRAVLAELERAGAASVAELVGRDAGDGDPRATI